MKRLLALSVALFVVGFFCSIIALAEIPTYIDALGCEVIVPDGWSVETSAEGDQYFLNEASQGRIVFFDEASPVEDVDTPNINVDGCFFLANLTAGVAGASDSSSFGGFDFPSDGHRIVGGSVTYTLDARQMITWVYRFTSANNTWSTCSFSYPTDGTLDILWFTDAMEVMFPKLSVVHADIPGNADGNLGTDLGNITVAAEAGEFLTFGSH